MRCWLCVTSPQNWEGVKKHRIWGVEDRYESTVKKISLGDIFVFYVKKPIGGIAGVYVVSSKWYYDKTSLGWNKPFPYRIRMIPLIVPSSPVELNDRRIEELLHFTDKSRDARRVFFLASMFLISDDDCRTMLAWLEEIETKQKTLKTAE